MITLVLVILVTIEKIGRFFQSEPVQFQKNLPIFRNVTGITENGVIKVGTEITEKIKTNLNKIDKFENKEIPKKKKERYIKLYRKKIKNLVT